MTSEERESAYDLQKIDCNCNNCIFMYRDMDKYAYWREWNRKIQESDFNRNKAKAIFDAEQSILDAETPEDKRSCEGILRKAHKMKFQFNTEGLISYGNCSKLSKPVSFIPNVCQIETQDCFVHRRDINP